MTSKLLSILNHLTIKILSARSNSASSTPRSSPNNSPMLVDCRSSREASPLNNSPRSPAIRSVINVTSSSRNEKSEAGRGTKRKSTDLDPPRKRDKLSKSHKKKNKEKISKKESARNQAPKDSADAKSHKMLKEIKREVNMESPSGSRSPLSNLSSVK